LQQIGPQRPLTVGPGRQGEDADDALAGVPWLQAGIQPGPDLSVGGVGQQLVAQLRVAERLRLAGQLGDDMAVVDTPRSAFMAHRVYPRQGHRAHRADVALDTLIEDMQPQPLPDQTRRHRVEHPLDFDGAGGGDRDDLLGEVGGAPRGQLPELCAFDLQGLMTAAVEAPNDAVEPYTIGIDRGEIGRSAQQQCLLDAPLDVAMG